MNANRWWMAGVLVMTACGSNERVASEPRPVGARDAQVEPERSPDEQPGERAPDGGRKADAGSKARPAAKDGGDACGKHTVRSERGETDLLIVLDRSGSMAPGGNGRGTDRWSGSVDAVVQLTERYADSVSFGLMTFPGPLTVGGIIPSQTQNDTVVCTPGKLDVPIGPGQADAIAQALSHMQPFGSTPTAATLEAALDVIGPKVVGDQAASANKVVLLLTDGDPNCSADHTSGLINLSFGPDERARRESVAAVEKLTEAGVSTYVVGYETAGTAFEGLLDEMAAAGGTKESTHRSVSSAQDLTAVFEEMAAKAIRCSYELTEPVDEGYVLVTVDGKPRKLGDAADGWSLASDARTVTLTGAACDAVKAGAVFTVEVSCELVLL